MKQMTPPMGWNSWNTFAADIDEQLIRETADKLVETGLADCGYNYLVIDDCWSLRERDENGKLVADPAKFPNGMKAVADYVHSKGLKFGMYSCAGTLTCAGYPGSYDHEFDDAATFAEWGVDFLKYDYCFHTAQMKGSTLYRKMGLALANCGRDIMLSACSWGADETHEWIRGTGSNMWRSTGDIFDSWESIVGIVNQQEKIFPYGGAGCFNDMDMLVVGMHGKGNVGLSGCSDVQYRTHFSVWALFGSPLMIGCDIRNMDEETKKILTNKDIIAINQDPACRQVIQLDIFSYSHLRAYARMLDNGDIAIGVFNFEADGKELQVDLHIDQLGLAEHTGKTLEMHNLWTGEVTTVKNATMRTVIPAHDCLMYRCKVVDIK